MVAISLYRGNLHRVSDAPRRWLMPTSHIPVKHFKTLLHRRAKALGRHNSSSTTSNPSPLPQPIHVKLQDVEPDNVSASLPEAKNVASSGADHMVLSLDCWVKPTPEKASERAVGKGNSQGLREELPGDSVKPGAETSIKGEVLDDKQKRRKEVEDKLQILNAKKHNLVQVLKQILNAEEELNKRNSLQGMTNRPHIPLQVDVPNDYGSMNRHDTPRMGSEANLGGDTEGEGAVSNHNMHSRHMFRKASTSPSSESPLRRTPCIKHTVTSHSSRASLVVSGSPSRFAPSGHQGHPPNLPTISMSGTNYVASSPSPAASGGTSVFRDTRLPSPLN